MRQPAILSGPSFAEDVARGLPTAVTLAAKRRDARRARWCRRWDRRPSGPITPGYPRRRDRRRGEERAGDRGRHRGGRKLGASAQAALTTRGFSELVRLGRACGARGETMAGLSGLGDLILTCSSPQSRNFALGIALGRGEARPRGKTRRRRIHRTGADRTGGFAKCRYAGIIGGGRDPERCGHHRCGDREPADAAVQGGGMITLSSCPRLSRASTSWYHEQWQERRGWPGIGEPKRRRPSDG